MSGIRHLRSKGMLVQAALGEKLMGLFILLCYETHQGTREQTLSIYVLHGYDSDPLVMRKLLIVAKQLDLKP